jgi:polygalacturonase
MATNFNRDLGRTVSGCVVFGLLGLFAPAVGVMSAQDTRTVNEPVIPPVCLVLKAKLAAPKGTIERGDELKLDTDRIQKGIDKCGKGRALELASDDNRDAFLSGPLKLKKGVTLLIDRGVTLYGSRDPEVYEKSSGSCGKVDHSKKNNCYALITVKRADDAGIMGDGTIDGRGGSKLLLFDETGIGKESISSWWDLANDARVGGRQQVPRMIDTDHSNNFTLYKITLKNSPNFHVSFHKGDGFTVWGIKIDTPKTARNTDGLDPSGSKNITIAHSWIRTGDDNVAIKAGDSPASNITVAHNHFYYGHGMSIGSETTGGVTGVRVTDLSIDGADNGLRIKSNPSRGGVVSDVVYDNVCIRNSKAPLIFDTSYNLPGDKKDKWPEYKNIVLENVRVSGGGKVWFNGVASDHRIQVRFDGVYLEEPMKKYKPKAAHADFIFGPRPVNFMLSGDDTTSKGDNGEGDLPSCDAMFVPFPGDKIEPNPNVVAKAK